MSLHLTNTFNVGDDATLELGGASYLTTAQVGEATYVFVASKFDSGVSVFTLEDDGTLHNVFNIADNNTMPLGGAFAVATAVVAGTTYLFVSGINDSGITAFSVAADGSLANVANVADDTTLKLSLTADVETVTVGDTTYVIGDGVNDNGVSVFAVGTNGHLTNVDNITDNGTANIQGPQGIASATVDGNTYVFVTGYHDDGVGVYSMAANGHLTNVFNVRDGGDLEIDGPVDALTAVVGGTTYLFVSGFDDDGLSVFSVAADGHLTNVFNLADDSQLELDNPVGMSTAVLNGNTYLFVVGADDDGLSVFLVGNDGTLTSIENVTDDATLRLDRPIGVTTVVINGQIYGIAASNNDNGVSVFTLHDDVNHAPTLTATGNEATFTEGGAPADLFAAPVASTVEAGQSFTSLKLTVTNVTDGASEILHFSGHDLALTDGNAVAGATVSLVGTTATVTLPGAPDAAALQQLIDDLSYRNTSQHPTESDRVVTITQLTDSGGTAVGGADTAALNIVSTVHVHAFNDPAIITGSATGDVTEAGNANGIPSASGDLLSTDSDNANDTWQSAAAGAATDHGYGTYQITDAGVWTYALDNANAAVQALTAADTLTDTFTVRTEDGTTQLVSVTIHGQNDAATITGTAAGDVTEAGVANGTPSASGDLLSTDVDNAGDAWQAVAAGAATDHGYGTYALTAAGAWTYALDNANAAVQALTATDTLTDTFTVRTEDGTTQLVSVTIHGQNDAATITGTAAGDVTEAGSAGNGMPSASGNLDSVDVDGTNDAWAVVAGAASIGGFGTYQVAANGQWTYTLDNANTAAQALNATDTLIDMFDVVTTDGTTQRVTVTIHGQNDAPVNTVPGVQTLEADHTLAIAGLAVGDPDAGDGAITTSLSVAHGTLTVGAHGGVQLAGSGTDTVTLSGSLAQINAVLAAGNVVYAPLHDFFGADTLTMTTTDFDHTGMPGSLSDTDTIKINVPHPDNAAVQVIGTAGPDSFVALPGDEWIDASAGIDTVTFDFRLVDATVFYQGNTIAIDGPHGSHTLLTGVERFVFTDGTVDNADDSPLVDDLFYYSANHDVWNAHLDADAHYHATGWQQGRDPNAFFSTTTYLSMHPEVKAAGVDPLVQFDQAGWKTGADPSIAFDTAAYLDANPDVSAAGVDPLAHFLQSGYEEGRQPIAPIVLLAQNGFDYVYYLQHNPDVAAVHVDPLLHYETTGWKEGRNPNAFFDTAGYLAAYHDVAAAGINPLDHYMTVGAREGRDPSGGFDTRAYLAANPDVAAAGTNPLEHFLLHGLQEGRSPHGDGVFN